MGVNDKVLQNLRFFGKNMKEFFESVTVNVTAICYKCG